MIGRVCRQRVFARRHVRPREGEVRTIRRRAKRRHEGAKAQAVRAFEKFDLDLVAILPVLSVGDQANIRGAGEYLTVRRAVETDHRRLIGRSRVVVVNYSAGQTRFAHDVTSVRRREDRDARRRRERENDRLVAFGQEVVDGYDNDFR